MTGRYNGNWMERVMADAANVALVIISAFTLWFVGTLAYPYDPVPELTLEVVGVTRAGSDLHVRVVYDKAPGYTPSEVRWSLLDGATIMLPSTLVALPPGRHTVVLVIPSSPHMTPGPYQLRVQGIYWPWPWRMVEKEATSPVFEVVP